MVYLGALAGFGFKILFCNNRRQDGGFLVASLCVKRKLGTRIVQQQSKKRTGILYLIRKETLLRKPYFKLIAKPAISMANGRSGLQPVDQLATLSCSSSIGLSNRTLPTRPTGQTETVFVVRI